MVVGGFPVLCSANRRSHPECSGAMKRRQRRTQALPAGWTELAATPEVWLLGRAVSILCDCYVAAQKKGSEPSKKRYLVLTGALFWDLRIYGQFRSDYD
jgi:hypothetical protein